VTAGSLAENRVVMEHGSFRLGLYQGHTASNLLNFRSGDVLAIAAYLEAQGLKLRTAAQVEPDGASGATIVDPDGNLVTESMKYWTVLDVTLSIPIPCHPEPFACCHAERSEASSLPAQGKLREGSLHSKILRRRTPQSDKHFLLSLVYASTRPRTSGPAADSMHASQREE